MTSIRDTLLAFLEQEAWPYEEIADGDAVKLQFQGSAGEWVCVVQWSEDGTQLVVYSICSEVVASEHRAATMELVTRLNFGLPVGAFELDLDEGELRFKTGIDFEGTAADPQLVRNVFYVNVSTMDHYLSALQAAAGGASAAQILSRMGEN